MACEIVQALQTMVTRRVDVFDPTVITVASIHAGTTSNVIPDHCDILGHHPGGFGGRPGCECTTASAGWPKASRRPTRPGRGGDGRRLSGHGQRPRLRHLRRRRGQRDRRRRAHRDAPEPDHGRRGLQLRPPAGPGVHDVPRGHSVRPGPADGAGQPLDQGVLRGGRDGAGHRPVLGAGPRHLGGRRHPRRSLADDGAADPRPGPASTACASSTSPACCPDPTAAGCWPTWAPTSSRWSPPRAT